ncbi:MAG: CocE/NonD family hydrolase, partial [bacterium]|nr:CocE/NonD family hydrolase [bacterium]
MPDRPLRRLPDREPCYPEVLVRPGVKVPMRDGIELATDLYFPACGGQVVKEPVPALLRRTPYNKGAANDETAFRLARHGYLVALQDVRGRHASSGVFDCFAQEAEDGFDAIEWLAAQSPCDGRVGTFGASYEAYAQAAAATQSPPHLAAMCHGFGYTHGYHSARQGGALDVFYLSYFVRMAMDGKEAQADPKVRR